MGLATAVAVGGLALSAGSTAMSFMQAGEQKDKQKQAEASAASAMAEARKKLEVNFYDQQAVKKEPYELQREALLSQGAQAIQAGQESDRGAAVTAGKVQMAQNEAQAGIRTEMGKEMTDIENKQLAEQSRLRDLGVQLDLGEAEGAQAAAANAEAASENAMAQGVQGAIGLGTQALNTLPLYFKDNSKTGATASPLVMGKSTGVNGPGPNPAFQTLASERYQSPNPKPGTEYGVFGVNYGQSPPPISTANNFYGVGGFK
jgi:hypothetical protein